MLCPKCKALSADDAIYCARCGKKLTAQKKSRVKSRGNGTGTAFKRGTTWTAQIVVGYRELPPFDLSNPENRRQRVPVKRTKSGFSTKAEALAYCPTLKANGLARPQGTPTLEYYWKSYSRNEFAALSDSKQTAYSIAWNKLSKLHNIPVDELTVTDLRETVTAQCKTYYPAKDCRTVLTYLFRLAAADGNANKDLPSYIQLPALKEKEREPFSDTEQTALWHLYESGDMRAAIPLLMIYTGMMPGEAFDLTVSQIHMTDRQIVGAGKKTKVRRETPITISATIIPVLEDLIAHARPSGRIFQTSEDKWRADYYEALRAAGCRPLQPYSCRHTTATALAITEGIAPQTIKKVMRWSTTKMLDRYAHPDKTDVLAAVDSLKKTASGESVAE